MPVLQKHCLKQVASSGSKLQCHILIDSYFTYYPFENTINVKSSQLRAFFHNRD